jgi:hypothetical protein
MARGNPENLRAAAQRKSQATTKRAETALRTMIKNSEPITFRGVARIAGCSIDFLYGNADLRRRIEHLRSQQQRKPAAARAHVETGSSNVVRALTAQLADLRRRHRERSMSSAPHSPRHTARTSNYDASWARARSEQPPARLLLFDRSSDGVAARFAAPLLRDGLVDWELFDVRRSLHLDAGGGYALLNPARKSIEVCSRLPEVDDSPTAIDRAGRVVQHPLRDGSVWIDVVVCCIELFLGDSGQLDAYADCHSGSSRRVMEQEDSMAAGAVLQGELRPARASGMST